MPCRGFPGNGPQHQSQQIAQPQIPLADPKSQIQTCPGAHQQKQEISQGLTFAAQRP